jgi:hypothetical protein
VLRGADPVRDPFVAADPDFVLLRAPCVLLVLLDFFVPLAGAAGSGMASAATRLVLRRRMRTSAFIGWSLRGAAKLALFALPASGFLRFPGAD